MLHDNMKALIDKRNAKKNELCAYMHIARTTLDKYLIGGPIPSDKIIQFAEYFHVSPGSLFDYPEEQKCEEQITIQTLLSEQNKHLSALVEQQKKQLEFFQYFFNTYCENSEKNS